MTVSYEEFKRGLESGESIKFNLPEYINSYTRSVVERIGQMAIMRVVEIYEAEIQRLKFKLEDYESQNIPTPEELLNFNLQKISDNIGK